MDRKHPSAGVPCPCRALCRREAARRAALYAKKKSFWWRTVAMVNIGGSFLYLAASALPRRGNAPGGSSLFLWAAILLLMGGWSGLFRAARNGPKSPGSEKRRPVRFLMRLLYCALCTPLAIIPFRYEELSDACFRLYPDLSEEPDAEPEKIFQN